MAKGIAISYLLLDPVKGGRRFRVVEKTTFKADSFLCEIPAGFETDFASIPSTRFFVIAALALCWAAVIFFGPEAGEGLALALVVAFALAGRLGAWGKWGWAAVLHDYLYSTESDNACGVSRYLADRLFWVFMRYRGTPLTQAVFIWGAVRLFGWAFWKGGRLWKRHRTS